MLKLKKIINMSSLEFDSYITNYQSKLHEGLILSSDVDLMCRYLRDLNIYSNKLKNNTIQISLFNKIDKLNIIEQQNKLQQVLKINGWFISIINDITNKQRHKINNVKQLGDIIDIETSQYVIKIESKFDIEEYQIPNKLYHVSLSLNTNKILKNDLTPKTKSKISKHNNRIYLCFTINDCKIIINNLKNNTNKKTINYGYKNSNYVYFDLFEITTKYLNNRFFKDPNYYERGLFTLENIPRKQIKKINSYKILK